MRSRVDGVGLSTGGRQVEYGFAGGKGKVGDNCAGSVGEWLHKGKRGGFGEKEGGPEVEGRIKTEGDNVNNNNLNNKIS